MTTAVVVAAMIDSIVLGDPLEFGCRQDPANLWILCFFFFVELIDMWVAFDCPLIA